MIASMPERLDSSDEEKVINIHVKQNTLHLRGNMKSENINNITANILLAPKSVFHKVAHLKTKFECPILAEWYGVQRELIETTQNSCTPQIL